MGKVVALYQQRTEEQPRPDELAEEIPEADQSWAALIADCGVDELPPALEATTEERFAWLLDHALGAMLAKRFAEAYQALREADALCPGNRTVQANLQRLREIGS